METFLLNLLDTIGKINFSLVWKITILVLVVFWIVILDWVWLDAGERTSNRNARVIYLLLVLFFNILGWIIYLIIRPSQTIEQIYWADLERRYLKYETSELGDCPKCGTQLYPGYIYCPKCGLELKVKCKKCEMFIDKNNKFCPYCGEKTNNGSTNEAQVPSKEVMEQQIAASKQEVVEVVSNEQTKYSVKKQGLTVKLGSAIINSYQKFVDSLKTKRNLSEKKATKEETKPQAKHSKKEIKKKKSKKH